MGVARRKRVEGLGRYRVKQGIDWICVGRLHAVVDLETKPGCVLLIEVVVDTDSLYLLMVVAGVRNALPVGATIPGGAQRAAKYLGGCAAGISVEGEHLVPIKRDQLRRRRI